MSDDLTTLKFTADGLVLTERRRCQVWNHAVCQHPEHRGCPTCNGFGNTPGKGTEVCPTCGGTGRDPVDLLAGAAHAHHRNIDLKAVGSQVVELGVALVVAHLRGTE